MTRVSLLLGLLVACRAHEPVDDRPRCPEGTTMLPRTEGKHASWTCVMADGVTADGPLVEVGANGVEHVVGHWRHGKRHGRWLTRYDDGRTRTEGWFYDGKAEGRSRVWTDETPQQLVTEISWKHGLRHGLGFEVHGGQYTTNRYANGRRAGTWTRYDEDHRVLGSRTYDNEGRLLAIDEREVAPAPASVHIGDREVTWEDCVTPTEYGTSKQCIEVFERIQACRDDRACREDAIANAEHLGPPF